MLSVAAEQILARVRAPNDPVTFDHHARLVRRLLGVPIALVSLISDEHQLMPGMDGLSEPLATTRESPLSKSYCKFVVEGGEPLIVDDARLHPLLKDNPAVSEDGVLAYAGWPLKDALGRTIGSLCAADVEPRTWTQDDRDILADLARGASAELQVVRDSDNMIQTVFDSVPVAIVFYDSSARLLAANDLGRYFSRLAGFDEEAPQFVGSFVRDAQRRPIPDQEQVLSRALAEDLTQETYWIGPPGNERALTVNSARVQRADGSVWGTLISAQDVTGLARAVQVREEFVTTVSHELRTPLTSVVGYLELLADELDPDNAVAHQHLEAIEAAAGRLRTRITELLDAADSRRHLELDPADLAEVVSEVCAGFDERASAAGVSVVRETPQAQWATVDRRRIEQVLENVVANAVKFTDAGGTVTVTLGGEPDAVTLTVADTGTGMSGDEVAQAFDSFWRGERSRREAMQGIGIGLTFVRDVVHSHHGTARIDSEPGVGTTVTLSLPRDPMRAAYGDQSG